jgi:hypothetical protein
VIRQMLFALCVMSLAIIAGCTQNKPPVAPQAVGPDPAGEKYLLAAEPAGAKNVIDLRKNARNGDEVVIVGRIGGDVNPWLEGKAGFLIADTSLTPCSARPGDTCDTPWDYCCDSGIGEGRVSVKIVNDQGETVAIDARKLLGLKELDTIVAKGKIERDDNGKFVVLASGLYRRGDQKK